MSSLESIIENTPECSFERWPSDPALGTMPRGVPEDIIQIATEFRKIHIYETPVGDGIRTNPGSFCLQPYFDYSVAALTLGEDEVRVEPDLKGLLDCYTLGHFGAGNEQLILDISNTLSPRLRYFFFYPIDPLSHYPVIPLTIRPFLEACILAGPGIRFVRELVDDQMR